MHIPLILQRILQSIPFYCKNVLEYLRPSQMKITYHVLHRSSRCEACKADYIAFNCLLTKSCQKQSFPNVWIEFFSVPNTIERHYTIIQSDRIVS